MGWAARIKSERVKERKNEERRGGCYTSKLKQLRFVRDRRRGRGGEGGKVVTSARGGKDVRRRSKKRRSEREQE